MYRPDPAPYGATFPTWLDEIDLTVSASHLRMGTRALRPEDWLLADDLAASELMLRRRLLLDQREHVFACRPPAEPAAEETGALVEQWLDAHPGPDLPAHFSDHPLERAGAHVQEDLCLMVHHDGAWHLEGAVLCFPSVWRLTEKIGLPADLLHAPVPHYAAELSDRVDTFFNRLAPGKPVWRRNFSLWASHALWAPYSDSSGEGECFNATTTWIRSERQTLRRLPVTGAIVFTIRVQMTPLTNLDHRPDRARDLAHWLRAPCGEHRRAELGDRCRPLLAWLDEVGRS